MRVSFRNSFLTAAMAATLGSSAATAAEKTEAVMTGTPDVVASSLIDEMTDRQYVLTAQTDRSLQFDRPIDNVALYPSLGGTPDRLPRARVVMTLAPMGGDTRVAADLFVVKNPGSKDEVVADVSVGMNPRIDRVLSGAQETLLAEARRDAKGVAMAEPARR